MQRIYQQMFTQTLPAIAVGESGVCTRLLASGAGEGELWLKGDQLRFTLPALFAFCVAEYNRQADERSLAASEENYARLRKLLFQQPPNKALEAFGLQVELALADLDPDRMVYKLTCLGESP